MVPVRVSSLHRFLGSLGFGILLLGLVFSAIAGWMEGGGNREPWLPQPPGSTHPAREYASVVARYQSSPHNRWWRAGCVAGRVAPRGRRQHSASAGYARCGRWRLLRRCSRASCASTSGSQQFTGSLSVGSCGLEAGASTAVTSVPAVAFARPWCTPSRRSIDARSPRDTQTRDQVVQYPTSGPSSPCSPRSTPMATSRWRSGRR